MANRHWPLCLVRNSVQRQPPTSQHLSKFATPSQSFSFGLKVIELDLNIKSLESFQVLTSKKSIKSTATVLNVQLNCCLFVCSGRHFHVSDRSVPSSVEILRVCPCACCPVLPVGYVGLEREIRHYRSCTKNCQRKPIRCWPPLTSAIPICNSKRLWKRDKRRRRTSSDGAIPIWITAPLLPPIMAAAVVSV